MNPQALHIFVEIVQAKVSSVKKENQEMHQIVTTGDAGDAPNSNSRCTK